MSIPIRSLASFVALVMLMTACVLTGSDGTNAPAPVADSGPESATEDIEGDGDTKVQSKEVATDFGVGPTSIRVGLSADLSGVLSGRTTPLVEAQKVFWEMVNDQGGVAGRRIDLVVLDSQYDVGITVDNYEVLSQESDEGVVMIGHVTGSRHNAAIAAFAQADNMVVVPDSNYSGWAHPDIGAAQFELNANYCIESMNGIEYLQGKVVSDGEVPAVGVLSYPGEYGQDGATGAKFAADVLNIPVVYDGEGALLPGGDYTEVVDALVESDATMVWISAGPADLANVFGAALGRGFQAHWSGNNPTFNAQLLNGDLGPALDQFYTHSAYTAVWDSNTSEGMGQLVTALTEARPNDLIQDVYVQGWIEALFTKAVLERAAELGDMTRAGVLAAANEVVVDFKGLAPDQTWAGDLDYVVVRETYLYEVYSASYKPMSMSSYAVLEDKRSAGTGLVAIDGYSPFSSDVAMEFDFREPCFVASGLKFD